MTIRPWTPATERLAGRYCASCGTPKPAKARRHCDSPACQWWVCQCDGVNDKSGRAYNTSARPT